MKAIVSPKKNSQNVVIFSKVNPMPFLRSLGEEMHEHFRSN